jgi:DNA-3-methyladenine glycosylase II
MNNALLHLQKDKKLAQVITQYGELQITERKNVFLWLVRSVAGQQLSTTAAATIFNRFINLIDGTPTPEKILNLSIEQLRGVGFSIAKSNYIQNIASYWLQHNLKDSSFKKLADEQVIDLLLPIKGVGKWTIEMLLMFTLGRQNIFAVDDLGIQQAMCKLYNWDGSDKKLMKEKMLKKSKTYEPYKTYACMYLWKYKDGSKTEVI